MHIWICKIFDILGAGKGLGCGLTKRYILCARNKLAFGIRSIDQFHIRSVSVLGLGPGPLCLLACLLACLFKAHNTTASQTNSLAYPCADGQRLDYSSSSVEDI